MAWTTPGTAVAGGVLTAAFLNTNVRDNLNAIRNPQKNVKQSTKLDTFNTTSSSFVDVTGLTVTITPTEVSSKIMIFASVNIGLTYPSSGAHGGFVRLAGGNASTFIGNAGGASQQRAAAAMTTSASFIPADTAMPILVCYLDSPATTSAITYSLQVAVTNQVGGAVALNVNSSKNDTNNTSNARTASTIIVMEVPV